MELISICLPSSSSEYGPFACEEIFGVFINSVAIGVDAGNCVNDGVEAISLSLTLHYSGIFKYQIFTAGLGAESVEWLFLVNSPE